MLTPELEKLKVILEGNSRHINHIDMIKKNYSRN